MWLGTDKGLARIRDDVVTLYRQFADWPFGWVRNVGVTPRGLALQTHVAEGNTGGNRAGSHLFRTATGTRERIGENILAQAWRDGYLYQATG